MAEPRRVIGIDPGSRITGWGVLDTDGYKVEHVAHGHILGGKGEFADRLTNIHLGLVSAIAEWKPTCASLEDVFVGDNPQSALKLGQARGVAILAATLSGMTVTPYPPTTVKLAVSGNGRANKEQLQKVVRIILKIDSPVQVDAGDALAIAICHAYTKTLTANMPVAPRRKRRGQGRGLRV